MKAKLLILLLILFAYAYAKEASLDKTDNIKSEINIEQLPEHVSASIGKTEYASCVIKKIYLISHQSPITSDQYEIHVIEAGEMVVLSYSKDGQLLKTGVKREG